MSLERKEATADVLHEQGPRPREERVAQDDREQADGGGSPPPPRGARPEEGQGGEASDGEGQGGSRRQVGGTRPKEEEAKRPRVRTRGLFEVERESGDVMPRSSLLPLFTGVRGSRILRSSFAEFCIAPVL